MEDTKIDKVKLEEVREKMKLILKYNEYLCEKFKEACDFSYFIDNDVYYNEIVKHMENMACDILSLREFLISISNESEISFVLYAKYYEDVKNLSSDEIKAYFRNKSITEA